MRTHLEAAPWVAGRPSEQLVEAIDLLRRDVWRDAAIAYFARRLALQAVDKQAPKGVQPFLNVIVDERFTDAGWLGSDGRFARGSTWVRVTFRHQMSLGSDIVDALKVCRKGGMTEAAILAASERFLDVITPNDARALVSFEKLRREVWDLQGCLDIPLFIGRLEPVSELPADVASTLRAKRPRDAYQPAR